MKFDFSYYNPTKIYFGRNSLDNLYEELASYGDTVLLIYGKGSVKKSGLYDKVLKSYNLPEKELWNFRALNQIRPMLS